MRIMKFKIGDKVRYHPIIGGDHDGKKCTVYICQYMPSLKFKEISGWVYFLKGESGYVAEEALSSLVQDVS